MRWTSGLVFLPLIVICLAAIACSDDSSTKPSSKAVDPGQATKAADETQAKDKTSAHGKEITTVSGLKYIDLKEGTGFAAQAGNKVQVHYTGWLKDGTEFDSSVGKDPLTFTLGSGRVKKGFDEGVTGMKIGGKRKLIIPPHLAYGKAGTPDGVIPPDAELTFEVELMRMK